MRKKFFYLKAFVNGYMCKAIRGRLFCIMEMELALESPLALVNLLALVNPLLLPLLGRFD